MRKLPAFLSLAVNLLACDSATPSSAPLQGPAPRPVPSDFGKLTILPDTGALVVGRRLRVVISAADASGTPVDAASTEVSSSNPAIVRLDGAIAIPVDPPIPYVNVLVATFGLTSVGSTAIHARLGILSDSIVITVVPP
jgi:hypothetical protein